MMALINGLTSLNTLPPQFCGVFKKIHRLKMKKTNDKNNDRRKK